MAFDAVYELVMAYGEYLEAEDYSVEKTEALFTENAKMLFAMGGPGQGIPEIAEKHKGMTGPFIEVTHNISNVVVRNTGTDCADICFHMEVLHQFRPEFAEKTPGNLFIVNDRIQAKAVLTSDGWKFSEMEMNTVFKRMANTIE